MKVLYIHQYFVTPDEHGTSRSYWFAKKLVEEGFQVTMITSTNEYKHKKPEIIDIEGIHVIYLKNEYSQYFSKIRKVYSFVTFVVRAIRQALKEKNVDLVFATSTPLTVGFIALVLKRIRKWKFVFEVRDLWPEFPIQVGAIKNSLLIRILRKLEKTIYQKAEHVIALSPGMAEGVLNCGIPENKVTIITNMSKGDLFYPRERTDEQFLKYGIDKAKFNVAHVGAMGVANGLDTVVQTARFLQEERRDDSINFIIAGDGATLPSLKQQVENWRLGNVKFIGEYDTYETSEILNCCDMSLVSFKNLPILYTNSPNKLFDSLSAGKPIIVNSAGWTKRLVEDFDCGFYVNLEEPGDLADKLLMISKDTEKLEEYARNSRKVSLEKFDKSILTCKFVSVINSVLHV